MSNKNLTIFLYYERNKEINFNSNTSYRNSYYNKIQEKSKVSVFGNIINNNLTGVKNIGKSKK